jgi:hypothetical protein
MGRDRYSNSGGITLFGATVSEWLRPYVKQRRVASALRAFRTGQTVEIFEPH